jgi:putative transposase
MEEITMHSKSFVKVYVHYVWGTKRCEKLLTDYVRPIVYSHILLYAATKQVAIECLNLQPNHIHLLTSLSCDQRVEDVTKFIKGESSHWINYQNLIMKKFNWQLRYFAFSVGVSNLDSVRRYILGQDDYHTRVTFEQEIRYLLRRSGYAESLADMIME